METSLFLGSVSYPLICGKIPKKWLVSYMASLINHNKSMLQKGKYQQGNITKTFTNSLTSLIARLAPLKL